MNRSLAALLDNPLARGHLSPVSGVAASGDRVATAGYDNRVLLWDGPSRSLTACGMHDHLVNQCSFDETGTLLLSTSSDWTARLWRVPEMRLLAIFGGHGDDVEGGSISPDGRLVATASRDGRVRIFNVEGALLHTLVGHRADVLSVEWADRGATLVSSGDDGTVRRWCTRDGSAAGIWEMEGVETDTITVTSEGVVFAGTDTGEIVRLCGTDRCTFPAHDAGIKRLVRHSKTGLLVSASYDRTIRVWNYDRNGNLTPQETITAPSPVWLRACAIVDPDTLLFGTFGSSFARYRRSTARWDIDGVIATAGVNALCLATDGAVYTIGDAGIARRNGRLLSQPGSLCNFIAEFEGMLVSGGQAGILYNLRTGEALFQHRSPLNCAAVLDGEGKSQLLVGTYTGEGLLFRRDPSGALVPSGSVTLHDNAVKGVTCAGGVVFSVCATGAAAWHRQADLVLLTREPNSHRKISNGAASLPDGRFVSVSRDLSLRIWRGTESREIVSPHRHSVKCVAVSRSGRLIATGAYDGHVSCFDLKQDRWLGIVRLTGAGISCLCQGQGSDEFLASSYDGYVYPVPVPAGFLS